MPIPFVENRLEEDPSISEYGNPDYTCRFRYITSDKKNRCNGVKNSLVILERACGDVLLW